MEVQRKPGTGFPTAVNVHRDKLAPTRCDDALIVALQSADAFPHPATNIEVLETHISWIVLSGAFAYKIKKPVKLGFLDFSTLDLRRHFCEEELRLNRRWAPAIYLQVVPICGTMEAPRVGGEGPAFEYAVKMARFPQQAILAAQLDAGKLTMDDMIELAGMLADQHRQGKLPESGTGKRSIDSVAGPMLENFDYLVAHLDARLYQGLRNWTVQSLDALRHELTHRKQAGFIRDCHGDLHLGNLVRLPSGIVAFDCIEFSESLRRIDVISDVAFLAMDLAAHDRQDLAFGFLNRYFECTGDYEGMRVFGLYFVYHCLIRAKVLAIRSGERPRQDDRQADLAEMNHYCEVARRWMSQRSPGLIITCGYSGTGKTWLSAQLMTALPAIRARSDIERKRLAGLDESAPSGSGIGSGLYAADRTKQTYARLFEIARCVLQAPCHVILDAAFLGRAERRRARKLAKKLGAGFLILELYAPLDTLLQRLQQRAASGRDASEAGVAVLHHQLQTAAPLDDREDALALHIPTGEPLDVAFLQQRVRSALHVDLLH
jgi:uncharacterized protein